MGFFTVLGFNRLKSRVPVPHLAQGKSLPGRQLKLNNDSRVNPDRGSETTVEQHVPGD